MLREHLEHRDKYLWTDLGVTAWKLEHRGRRHVHVACHVFHHANGRCQVTKCAATHYLGKDKVLQLSGGALLTSADFARLPYTAREALWHEVRTNVRWGYSR